MTFWTFAILLTLIACAALYYASAARGVNARASNAEAAVTAHYRAQLKEIEDDIAGGEMSADDGEVARAEIAREFARQSAEAGKSDAAKGPPRFVLPVTLAAIVVVSFGTYWVMGHPDMPAEPLSSRTAQIENARQLQSAISKVEAHLKDHPEDVRGWQVLAPIYLRQGRYQDAVDAYRKVIALSAANADADVNLAEALAMQNGGEPDEEAIGLLKKAAALDKTNVRARFYLASYAMQNGDYADAVSRWKEIIALAKGGEQWLPTAQLGLKQATAALSGAPVAGAGQAAAGQGAAGFSVDPAQRKMIEGMVDGLAARLQSQGGSIEEWTRLVRSRLVLGDKAAAQKAYTAAVAAYPDPAKRTELDNLARGAGLKD